MSFTDCIVPRLSSRPKRARKAAKREEAPYVSRGFDQTVFAQNASH
jgi:hypothetical protein